MLSIEHKCVMVLYKAVAIILVISTGQLKVEKYRSIMIISFYLGWKYDW